MAVQQIVDCGQGNSAAQVRIERLLDLPDNQNAALGCFSKKGARKAASSSLLMFSCRLPPGFRLSKSGAPARRMNRLRS